jgi:hypothetical protein
MSKEMVSAKLSSVTKERLEEYADRVGISRSEAVDRMVKQGLDVEESDMRLVPVRSDGGTVIEDELENTQNQVTKLSQEIGQFKSDMSTLGLPFLIAIIWIFVELAFDIPFGALGSATTGIAVIGWLMYSYYQVVRNE